jgi:hypothetical protein
MAGQKILLTRLASMLDCDMDDLHESETNRALKKNAR